MTSTTAAHGATVQTRGVHHLALNTDDMQMTIAFYTGVLGMPLVHALKVPPGLGTGPGNRGNPPFENLRHYFFDAGGDCLLAFFEIPKGAKDKADRDAIAGMQHCSFAVTEARFESLCARLRDAGVALIGPIPTMLVKVVPDAETACSTRFFEAFNRLSRRAMSSTSSACA